MNTAARFSLAGRTVVITGGLGQLGRQYTRAVLDMGGTVAALDMAPPAAEYAERFAPEQDEGRLFTLSVDVTDKDSLAGALCDIIARAGVPHGLVNNAALDSPPGAPAGENGPLEGYPLESFDRIMQVNVTGCLAACQVFGGAMAEAGRGSIVNICSTYGLVSPDQRLYDYRRERGEDFFKPVSYAASKSAMLNLTRYMATYWAARGVRVNTLTPGGVFNAQEPAFLEGYARRTPLGRMADEAEYNGAIVFLLSDASSYMTGANLVIDGGWTAW